MSAYRFLKRRYYLACLLGAPTPTMAEEKSILTGAMTQKTEWWSVSYSDEALFDLCFKTRTLTDKSDNNSGKKELAIKLTESQNLITTYVNNGSDHEFVNRRLGRSHIWAGDDTAYLSTANT